MYFNQIMTPGLGCFSYCIGCPQAQAMIVVDPKRDIQDYLDISREEGMRIVKIIDTHVHADHVSGGQELSAATGAEICMYETSPVTYKFTSLKEGDILEVGAAKLEILHTPGHTPDALSLVITDKLRSSQPEMILTGDVLFVGDAGRPDLAGEEIIEEQAANLYNSLYVKLAKYPDYVEVFPGHGQGSLCGKGMSSKRSSTLGYERLANPMLQYDSLESFKKDVLSGFPVRPKSFTHIINTNKQGANLLDACPMDKALNVELFEREIKSGSVVLDTRDSASFGGFHIPGSINIGLEKQLANWVGMTIDPNSDLLLVVDDKEDYDRMVTELHRIGYDRIFGYLMGGISAWIMSGREVSQLGQISCHQLSAQLGQVSILDVRTPAEWKSGRIAGAQFFPLSNILAGKMPELSKEDELVVYCGSGFRGNIAGSLLGQAGFSRVRSMAGGVFAWRNAGFELVN